MFVVLSEAIVIHVVPEQFEGLPLLLTLQGGAKERGKVEGALIVRERGRCEWPPGKEEGGGCSIHTVQASRSVTAVSLPVMVRCLKDSHG